ncbi:MAG TPA: hypothetical protein VGN14_00375, partial [Candidatus Elarobacter sp.]
GCETEQLRAAVAQSKITKLGRAGGGDIVYATIESPCICGNVNCPVYVLRLDGANPKLLYSNYAYSVVTVPAVPLASLVLRSHDSALVSDETLVAYRNGRYVEQSYTRVRGDNGARKPDAVPIRFPAGASSTTLAGSASTGWYDGYSFDAQQGQTLTVSGVRSKGKVGITIFVPTVGGTIDVTSGKPVVIPRSGTYQMHVEIAADADVRYALTIAIR